MKGIIFGINGQDGFYLKHLLESKSIEVIGVSRSNAQILGDIADLRLVEHLIQLHKPQYIFHLAAVSKTAHSFLYENHAAIYQGSLHILESCLRHSPHSKIFLSGSGLQFKNNGSPITETDPFEIRDAYSLSRVNSVLAARYFRTLGLKVYVGYFFNHDSPRRSNHHLNQYIIAQVAKIAAGNEQQIVIGDPVVQKEFLFAGDAVAAVWTLVQNETIYECVIGSGIPYPITHWLDICFARYGLDWKKFVKINDTWTSDHKILVSNPTTIKSLGWHPTVDIVQLEQMMFEQN